MDNSENDSMRRLFAEPPNPRLLGEPLSFDRYDPCEIDPPTPSQIFTRLGLLLGVAIAFGLVAELLVPLPHH
jgi:hypothetical protein